MAYAIEQPDYVDVSDYNKEENQQSSDLKVAGFFVYPSTGIF
ncbi:hypothetical protein PVOR_17024 [Paenibacillus vortex V453]|uniref:Uncharacterized protein n=1 Tax=Paenibacillus vortex V453 TaxID=715225 RepID=A0A2R9ST97_9BACL|nr:MULTISPECIES: hypothetical protein [Paenibacillus]EFU40605.1 hypothetical protein PVOR_17024 [Paenibacillus vortex V453]